MGRTLSLTAQQGTPGKVGSRAQEAHQILGCVSSQGQASSLQLRFCLYLVPSAALQPFTFLIPICHGWAAPCQLVIPMEQDRESQRVPGLQRDSEQGPVRAAGLKGACGYWAPGRRKCLASFMLGQA